MTRLNYETCIVGTKCVLVPYRLEHVPKYHDWMLDPHLLEMTGSEPLSLEDEIAMQQDWRDDDAKCTFIVLAKDLCDFSSSSTTTTTTTTTHDDPTFCRRNLHAMVGDVNLFFSDLEESEDEEEIKDGATDQQERNKSPDANGDKQPQLQAELDIMIAEKAYRGKGLGKEACCLMMLYGFKAKNIARFFCKIKETNVASLALFRQRLGFQQCAYAACFQEVELERTTTMKTTKTDTSTTNNKAENMTAEITELLGGGDSDHQFEWKTFSCSVEEKPP